MGTPQLRIVRPQDKITDDSSLSELLNYLGWSVELDAEEKLELTESYSRGLLSLSTYGALELTIHHIGDCRIRDVRRTIARQGGFVDFSRSAARWLMNKNRSYESPTANREWIPVDILWVRRHEYEKVNDELHKLGLESIPWYAE